MAKRKRKIPVPARDGGKSRRGERAVVLGVFLLALALRLLFWQATPDADWAYSAYYKGDAPLWLDYARALDAGRPFELGLPLRPPGNGFLVASLWDGSDGGVARLRFLWCLFGAAAATLVHLTARRAFGLRIGLVVGLWASASTALLVLSTAIDNETPYLALVAAILYLWRPVREGKRVGVLALWGLLNAAACLLRVEHALTFALFVAFLLPGWARAGGWRGAIRPLVPVVAAFVLALLPWHLVAWRAIERFNASPVELDPGSEGAYRRLEASIAHLEWTPEALAERERLPAFSRRSASAFVAATAFVRGRRTVRAEDFEVLEDAFGTRPEPLASYPFVALYGGLNFYLANNPDARGGFTRAPLEKPLPLEGGAHRYPQVMIQGLPPAQLALLYLPHLEIVNHGYAMGWEWVRQNPGDAARLAGRKLVFFWQGAALGWSGWDLPLGWDGVRRAVDLAVPLGPVATLWRLALLVLVAVGLVRARRVPAVLPWVLYLASRVVVVVLFYGYARQGALAVPTVALLAAIAVLGPEDHPLDAARRRWLRGALLAGLVLLALELVRQVAGPEILLDGRPVGASDPHPVGDHVDRRFEVRVGHGQPEPPQVDGSKPLLLN